MAVQLAEFQIGISGERCSTLRGDGRSISRVLVISSLLAIYVQEKKEDGALLPRYLSNTHFCRPVTQTHREREHFEGREGTIPFLFCICNLLVHWMVLYFQLNSMYSNSGVLCGG